MLKFELRVTMGDTPFHLTTFKRSLKHLEHHLRMMNADGQGENDDRKRGRKGRTPLPKYKILNVVKCAA